jgi:octaprenyl-diphosphate synthase
VIYSKTARLFEAATHTAAIIANADIDEIEAMRNYGRYLGTAFQLVDDVLDYESDDMILGKKVGDDLAEGKTTLPLLHAFKHASSKQKELIRNVIMQKQGREKIAEILLIMSEHQSLLYARKKAKEEVDKAIFALNNIPDSAYKEALISLAHISVERIA